jgi:protein DGCR14
MKTMSKQSSYSTGTQHSKQRRLVLSEEEYTSTLSSIVQRNFFPDLPDLERQAALLEKRSQGDVPGAVAIRRAARQLADHEEALAAQEEEDEDDLEEKNVRRRARPLHQESITGFHARVTNENDVDFDSKHQKKEVKAN